MRSTSFISLSSLLLLSFCLMGTKVKIEDVKQLTFLESSHDFGRLNRGDKVRHEFKFQNQSKIPVKILATHTGCGCAVVDVPKKAFQPGETGVLLIELDTSDHVGEMIKTVLVVTDEAVIADRVLTVRANVNQEIWADPPLADFGEVMRGVSSSYTIKIDSKSQSKVTKIEYDQQRFSAVLSDGDQQTIEIRPKTTLPKGKVRSQMWVHTNNKSQQKFRIPLLIDVVGHVLADRSEVDLGSVKYGSRKIIVVNLTSKKAFGLEGAKLDLFMNGNPIDEVESYVVAEALELKEQNGVYQLPVKMEFYNVIKGGGGAIHGQVLLPVLGGKETIGIDIFGLFLEPNMGTN